MNQSPTKVVMAEFDALKKLNHPHIVNLHEIIDDPNLDKFYMVMDLYPGGNLDEKLQKTEHGIEEEQLRTWMRQIVSALVYCHD